MTEPSIKYSDYRREVSVERVEVSYNLLTQRTDKTAKKPDKVKLSLRDASQLIRLHPGPIFRAGSSGCATCSLSGGLSIIYPSTGG